MKIENVLRLRHPCVYMTGRDKDGAQRCIYNPKSLFCFCPYTAIGFVGCTVFCATPVNLNKRFWRKFKGRKMGMLPDWVVKLFVWANQGYQERKSK